MRKIYLIYPEVIGKIKPEIYGHFSEHIGGVIYDGIWVGRDSSIPNIRGFRKDLVEKFKKIRPPVLRWPGGCFAETYDWRDGIGEDRPTRPNWWTKWDGRYEPNAVGTHEFIDLCEMVGAKPYFAANITSTTPMEIRNWMDYCLSPQGSTSLAREREKNGHPQPFCIPYWGIGNENWGGGGNMEADIYAHEYRKYSTIADNMAKDVQFFACGPNGDDFKWTKKFFEVCNNFVHGFSLHFYCGGAGDPVNFSKDEWYRQLKRASYMEDLILRHWSIIKGFGMDDKTSLVIDEWGCWHRDGSGPSKGFNLFEQQSTMRDALVSALTLNIFNNNCEKIAMANVAQLVNNLHALFLAGGEHCIVTPTYHVFDMYKDHQGATAIRAIAETEAINYTDWSQNQQTIQDISISASFADGYTTITVANLSADNDIEFLLEPVARKLKTDAVLTTLTHLDYHAHNTFEQPECVMPVTKNVEINRPIIVPKCSVVSIKADTIED